MAKKKKTPKSKKGQATSKKTVNTAEKTAPAQPKTPKAKPAPKVPKVDFIEEKLGSKAVFLMLGILSLMAFFVYGNFWFTDNVFLFKDIGSDTINIFYPNYYWNAATWEQEGAFPTWSFGTGMGQDILLGSVNDPFIWLLYLMGKDSILGGLAYIEAVKVILAGLCFYAYLRTMTLSYLSALIGGLVYAFSGFMMIGSGWYVFTIEGLYFALLLLAFERYLMLGKWGLFPVALMLIAIWQPVDVYIMAVLIATYGTIRILELNDFDWGDLLKKYLQLAGLGALGLGMGSLVLLPSIDLMLNSPRVLGESSFFQTLQSKALFDVVDPNLWETTKARLLSTNLLVDNEFNFRGAMNYLEAPAIYCGLGTLLLIPQAFAFMEKKAKMLYAGLLGLYLLPLWFPYFRYTFWLYAGDYFRLYSLFIVFILLYLAVKGAHYVYEKQQISWIGLGVGALITLFLLFSIGNTEIVQVNESSRSFLALLVAVNAIVLAAWGLNDFRPMARVAFLVVLCLDILMVAKPTLNNRSIAKEGEFTTEKVGYNDYTVDAIAHIRSTDDSFHRLEKYGYHSGLAIHGSMNDAKVQDYFGTKSYHSFNQLNYIRFLGALDIIDETNENETRWAPGLGPSRGGPRPLLSTMVSNKYILTKAGKDRPVAVGYQHIGDFGDVSVFQNQYFLPLGFTYDKVILRSEFDKMEKDKVSKDIALLKAFVVEDDKAAAFSSYGKLDLSQINPQAYSEIALVADVKARKQEHMKIIDFKNAHIKGEITLSEDKVVFLSIPFDKGWSATVDGQPAEIHQLNVGFSGLALTKGSHQIELMYATPYASTGRWITLLALLGYAGLLFWRKKTEEA